jgi:hypothetical protein
MILPQEVEMGAHSGVLLFSSGQQRTYIWTHPVSRPWGIDQPQQCGKCGVLKSWKPKIQGTTGPITLVCSACGNKPPPIAKPDRTLVHLSNGPGSSGGSWYYVDEEF